MVTRHHLSSIYFAGAKGFDLFAYANLQQTSYIRGTLPQKTRTMRKKN